MVSDSSKVSPINASKVKSIYERIKIPLYKKNEEKRVWLLPALAWNNYDKTQLGIILGIEKKNQYQFIAIPMLGLGSKNLTGVINGTYQFSTPKIKRWELVFNGRRFSYLLFPEDLSFNRIQAKLRIVPDFAINGEIGVGFKSNYIWQEYILNGRQTQAFNNHQILIDYTRETDKYIFNSEFVTEFNAVYGLSHWTNNFKYNYPQKKDNSFYLRAFIGGFLFNNKGNSSINPPLPIFQLGGLSNSGIYWLQKDYSFDDFYFDRNAQDNFLQRQVANSEGGFKSVMSAGNANLFMTSINIKSDILIPYHIKKWFNVQPFANAALSLNRSQEMELYAEGGLSLLLLDEIIGFHFPFVSTTNIKTNQQTVYGIGNRDWTKRISFSVDLLKLKKSIQYKH